MKRVILRTSPLAGLLAAAFALPALAYDAGAATKEKIDKAYSSRPAYSPYVGRNYPTRPYFGDTYLHTFLSPNDEFDNFERWDKSNLDGGVAKTKDMLQFEYARAGLKHGLALEKELGTNPYKFGLIGSSDAHTGLAAMERGELLRQNHAAGT